MNKMVNPKIIGSIEFFKCCAREVGLDDTCSKDWPDNWLTIIDDELQYIPVNQLTLIKGEE